jgi:hypothetical protein
MNRGSLRLFCIVAGALLIGSAGCSTGKGSKDSAKAKSEAAHKAEVRGKKPAAPRPAPLPDHASAAQPAFAMASMGGSGPVMVQADSDSAALQDLTLTPEPYYYESVGRRDIFVSLVSEEYKAEAAETARPSSGELRVVGILWAENDRFALVESEDGKSRILHEGDSLGDGTVVRVLPDRIVVHVNLYGTSRNVTLPLVEGGGFDESPKSRAR